MRTVQGVIEGVAFQLHRRAPLQVHSMQILLLLLCLRRMLPAVCCLSCCGPSSRPVLQGDQA